jgi:hypothetical protein
MSLWLTDVIAMISDRARYNIKIFLSLKASRPAPGSPQPPSHWAPGTFFLREAGSRGGGN